MKKLSGLVSALLIGSSLNAWDFEASVGVHDTIVPNIVNDTQNIPGIDDGISAGTSNTFGLNVGMRVRHKIENINMFAKIDVFLDNDKDHLDPDHIPIWFDSLIDIDGNMYKINEKNILKWFVLMDNKQNTVSCIEREVRQHIGVGYNYTNSGLSLEANAYLGFYFIELDDDTPVNRGYARGINLDLGEASNMFELQANYNFTENFYTGLQLKSYATNAGRDLLENDAELNMSYKTDGVLGEGSAINLKVKYTQYNWDPFNEDGKIPVLPFDSDILVQAYITIPVF